MITLIYTHPFQHRSIANASLLNAVNDLPFVHVRDLYARYPDFDIDVRAERQAIEETDMIVLQHPFYWYSMPSLLKLWIDTVFGYGWAYGEESLVLNGKQLLWVVTTGAAESTFAPDALHGHSFDAYTLPMKQIARFCGMQWMEPIIVHDAHRDQSFIQPIAQEYRQTLTAWHEAQAKTITAANPASRKDHHG